jgi:transmembrane protein 222
LNEPLLGVVGMERWILPFIGHMGICTSDGVIHDFAGPFFVSVDNFAFGHTTKRWKVSQDIAESQLEGLTWDNAIQSSKDQFEHEMYNLCCHNCHSFVASCLSRMGFKGRLQYSALRTWALFTWHSTYVSFPRFVETYLPSIILYSIIALILYFVS